MVAIPRIATLRRLATVVGRIDNPSYLQAKCDCLIAGSGQSHLERSVGVVAIPHIATLRRLSTVVGRIVNPSYLQAKCDCPIAGSNVVVLDLPGVSFAIRDNVGMDVESGYSLWYHDGEGYFAEQW